jgi:hypothetical protein
MLKKYKSPGSGQIPAELILAWSETSLCAIHKVINSIWNKEELADQRKESITVPIHKKGNKTDCNNYHGFITATNWIQNCNEYPTIIIKSKKLKNSMVLVHEWTILTERPLLVGEVSANFCG